MDVKTNAAPTQKERPQESRKKNNRNKKQSGNKTERKKEIERGERLPMPDGKLRHLSLPIPIKRHVSQIRVETKQAKLLL